MPMVDLLYSLLVTGAGLAATGAVSEFAKGAGKAAFEALKTRLSGTHGAASVALVAQAKGNKAYEEAIKSDLARPEISEDVEVRRLADELRRAIDALPSVVKAPYAVDIGVIESGKSLLFDNVEGVHSDKVTSKEEMTFKNVKAPPGK
jgi:hypothetical protein